jgi:mannose-6-phosphate isomerase-like protein (cupin superfamily)
MYSSVVPALSFFLSGWIVYRPAGGMPMSTGSSPTISDISIINWNTAEAKPVASGLERTLCSEGLCGSKTLTVHQRTVLPGRQLDVSARDDYHLVYVIEAAKAGIISFNGKSHAAEEGAGVLLAPGETARFEASGAALELLHMVTPKPPAAVEGGLPGGPGYFFNRSTLRPLSDASGGRVRRFCAESTVRLLDGARLTPTNAIQAGEMHYHEGGSSPYHRHVGTAANPSGASHCYITFKGRGVVEVGDTTQELEPGTLVYFPPGIPHRLRAHGGPLDYFELQAWRSFKTDVLSEEPLGLKWYYDPVTPDAARVEWDQS